VAMTGDLKLWGVYVTFAALAKVAAFGIQYVVFRTVIRRRVRATTAAAALAPAVAQ
jgi:intracellular septation protein